MKRIKCGLVMALALSTSLIHAAVKSEPWGKAPSGTPVLLYTLDSGRIRVQLAEYGARVVSVEAPDRQGKMVDVVLGYNNLDQYVDDPDDYFGAIVGRYGNRIAKGTFSIDGQTYHVPTNNNGNALHGGPEGFSSKVWKSKVVGSNKVEFTPVSPDGDMGFPGTMTVHVTYTLMENRLRIDYEASSTKTTVVNLTNHSYFNLAGENSGSILGQVLQINADGITSVDQTLIPTGTIDKVNGTPFDFRQATAIGKRIGAGGDQLKRAGGYDHNFVLNGKFGILREVAYAFDPASGRTLTVLTTEPGIQFYSGNFLNGSARGFSGKPYGQHAGFALETQHFPDSPNHSNFPSTVLKPGESMHSSTVFVFGVQNQGQAEKAGR